MIETIHADAATAAEAALDQPGTEQHWPGGYYQAVPLTEGGHFETHLGCPCWVDGPLVGWAAVPNMDSDLYPQTVKRYL